MSPKGQLAIVASVSKSEDEVVGHVSRYISAVNSLYMRHSGIVSLLNFVVSGQTTKTIKLFHHGQFALYDSNSNSIIAYNQE